MRVLSAYTVYPNTSETDRESEVLHEVLLRGGGKVRVMSSDPISAIDMVNGMSDAEVRGLNEGS